MIFDYSDILSIALAGFLLVFSFLMIIFRRNGHDMSFFGLASLCLSFVILLRCIAFYSWLYHVLCLLIWPSFFLFSKLQHKRGRRRLNDLWHFLLPFIWGLLLNFLQPELQGGVFEGLYLFQFSVYIGLSISEIHKTSRLNSSTQSYNPYYLKVIFLGLIALLLFRFTLPVMVGQTANTMNMFHVAVGVYFVMVSGFFIDHPILSNTSNSDKIQSHELANYEEEMKRKLNRIMKIDQAYLSPELTLNDLAALAQVKLPELSGFINTNLGKNFNDFVNDYRMDEFKKLVISDTRDTQATIMELAYQSGFNSKASFNRIFKERTGLTPTQFKRNFQKRNEEA